MAFLFPDNFAGTIELLAQTGGAILGTICKNSDGVVYLAMAPSPGSATTLSGTTIVVTSGNTLVGLIAGKVKSAIKITGTAWTAGMPLAFDGTAFTTVTTATRVAANAAAVAATGATTGDVILCPINALSPA